MSPRGAPPGSAPDGAASPSARVGQPRPAALAWMGLLLGVFALESFLFDQFGTRHHTGVYPKWNDQVQYLTYGYNAWEHARTAGFVSALLLTLTNPSAQGTLHDTAALLAFQLAGPSRSAALALIAWQFALFVAVARISRRPSLAFTAALLPLAPGPWENIPGSTFDFRLDHFAMCALGVASAAALLTDRFRSRGGAVLFGLAVALTLLFRFFTGTYFVLIFAGLLAWIVSGADRRSRSANLAWAAGVAFVLAVPFFWINRAYIHEYYWIGHYIGPESAIRNQNFGVGRSIVFILQALAERHLGWFFGVVPPPSRISDR